MRAEDYSPAQHALLLSYCSRSAPPEPAIVRLAKAKINKKGEACNSPTLI